MSESDFPKPDLPPLVSLPAASRTAPPAPQAPELPEGPALEEVKIENLAQIAPPELISPDPFPVPSTSSPAPEQAAVEAPKAELISPIRPKYPRSSRKRGEEGVVEVEVEVNSEGMVDSATIHLSSGYKSLDEAALEAVKFASFTKVKAKIFLSIDFRLR